jgi:hypothetical protein
MSRIVAHKHNTQSQDSICRQPATLRFETTTDVLAFITADLRRLELYKNNDRGFKKMVRYVEYDLH